VENILLVSVVLTATALAGWFYWQTQKAEQRISETAAQLAEQAGLVGEMVDEVFAASQHLYHEMDRWQALADTQMAAYPTGAIPGPAASVPETESVALAGPDTPTPQVQTVTLAEMEQAGDASEASDASDYTPHLQAIKMAVAGDEPVEIARQTGIGIEELRLLLRFQEAVNSTVSA